MRRRRALLRLAASLGVALLGALHASAQTPSEALLVLAKSDLSLAIVDPASLRVVGRVPSGPDPHEVIASADGRLAYISNYGGSDSDLHTISVVDLISRKALPAIDLGALHSAHGLAFAGGKLYFTAETNKALGRYDPLTGKVDWVLGTGQDRTHMVWVSESLEKLVTSNVSSGTISIIERVSPPNGGFGPPPGGPPGGGPPPGIRPPQGGPRKTWEITNVRSGNGSEGFDVSPDGKEIWAANARDATVTIIDFAGKHATQTFPISVNGANRLKFTPDGTRVFVSGLGFGGRSGSDLVVIDAASRKEIKHFDLGGGAAGILMVPDGSRAFVAVSGKDYVAVVDLGSLEITGRISAGKQPDGLAWAVRK
jgi:DNA-binding beta-propeller fold protein YncE